MRKIINIVGLGALLAFSTNAAIASANNDVSEYISLTRLTYQLCSQTIQNEFMKAKNED